MAQSKPRIAIVHDWLTSMGGAEPTVLEIAKLFPDAPIYTSVYDKKKMPAFHGRDVRTTYLQKILPPFLRYKHTLWPVLRAFAFRKLDLREYDIIISSSSAEAKAVKKKPGAIHICYCHTPTRYYWSHYEEFKNEFNFGMLTPFIRLFIPPFVRWMRKLDLQTVKGIDLFIANSEITKKRIRTYYKRDSVVVYPPVRTKLYITNNQAKRDGYIVWGRHVPYKRFDLAIQACNELNAKLTVVGSGVDTERLKKLAGPTISFPGRISDAELVELAHRANAFIFPNEEDFGIAPVEAMAAGLPLIAYKKGGALDIVSENETGIFFMNQTVTGLTEAIKKFEVQEFKYNTIVQRSKRFDTSLFQTKIRKIITDTTMK